MDSIECDLLVALDRRATEGDVISARAAAAIRSAAKIGRPPINDGEALKEMEHLIACGDAGTIGQAAKLVALTLAEKRGHESTMVRLKRKYLANKT